MLVKEIMTMAPVVVTPTDNIMFAAQQMRDAEVGLLPIVESQLHKRLVGVITDRDLTVRCTAAGASLACLVEDYMTPPPIETVYPESPIISAIDIMERRQLRRLVVVDIDETVLGMITQADIARHLAASDPGAVAELVATVSQPEAALI
jgi:CBS domain-containing protein